MKRAALKKNERGVTLMEVMIAMIILTVALLTLLNMAMVALDGNDWSNKTTSSTQLMQDKLEELRNQTGGPTSGQDTLSGVNRKWTVTDGGNFLWKVIISAQWTDVRNHSHKDSLIAYVKSDSI